MARPPSCKQAGRGGLEPDFLEELRRVLNSQRKPGLIAQWTTYIGKHNRPAQLLAHHDSKPQQHAFPIPRQPHLLDLHAVRLEELGLDAGLDLGILLHRLQAGSGLATDVGQVGERRVVAALLHQPARRLLERDHAQQEADSGDNLQRDGDAPLVVASDGQTLLTGVVDPVGDGDAKEDEEAVEGDYQSGQRASISILC